MVAPAYMPGDPSISEPDDGDDALGVPADFDGGDDEDGGDEFDLNAFERRSVREERAMMTGMAGRGAARKSYPYMYWRKPEDPETGRAGDVTFGPSWAPDFMDWQEQGFTPLFKYGRFGSLNPREPGGPWEPNKEPYRRILLHATGPREFSIESIVEMGWHRKAPYPGVRFPQLHGVDLAQYTHVCRICRKQCPSEPDLLRHQQIAHKDRSSSEKLSRDLAEAIGQGQRPQSAAVDQLASIAAAQVQQSSARDAELTDLRVMMAQVMQQNQLLMARLLGGGQPSGEMPPPDPRSDGEAPVLPTPAPAKPKLTWRQRQKQRAQQAGG